MNDEALGPRPTEHPVTHRLDGPITIDSVERYAHGLRWKLGISTNPCIQARRSTRCVYCGFRNHGNIVPPDAVGHVLRRALESRDLRAVRRLEIYVSGSFFDEQEVSEQSTDLIAQLIAGSTVNEVVLESRPEFVTEDRLRALAQRLDPSRVIVAVGVETMDDELRSRLGKNFSTDDVVRSIEAVAQAGMGFQAYLLLNPPLINDDRSAIVDVLTSSRRILRLTSRLQCKTILAVQPYFVAKESTIAERLSAGPPPRPPWLYTIALVLGLLDAIRGEGVSPFHIILGNEVDNVDTLRIPANYTADGGVCTCTDGVRQRLREVNISCNTMRERVQQVLAAPCECREAWEQQIVAGVRELASTMPDAPW